jgi:uncharacterized protein YbbC (DUF1343 family)
VTSTTTVRFGLERALVEPPALLTRARRFGVLVNQASVDRGFRYAHELLAERFPGKVGALFGPQHGLWSEQQDNMIETGHAVDPTLGVPIYSLYSERRKPSPEMLDGLDLVVVDLQDVGTRVYTYIWTLWLLLEAAAEAGVGVLVLDRPNPIGGTVVEGPSLSAGFESFVGLRSIPMRHGLTIGELARHFVRDSGLDVELEVVPVQGWSRDMIWTDLDRPWVPTSPNLPRFEGVVVYPGQVLLEGSNLSEGRGSTTPFELCGAPWLDGTNWAEAALALGADPQFQLRALRFEPTFHKFQGESCGALFLHATGNVGNARSYRTTLALLASAQRLAPEQFGWRPPPYEYEADKMPIDILTGDSRTREAIDSGATRSDLDALAAVDEGAWWAATEADRLY